MAILQIEYTQQPDCRVPDSTVKSESIELDHDEQSDLSYSELICKMAESLNINPDEFHCEVRAQSLNNMNSIDASDFMKSSQSIVLDGGQLKVLSRELKPVWNSQQDSNKKVAWWLKKLACHVKQIYPPDVKITFQVQLASGDLVNVAGSPHDTLETVLSNCASITEKNIRISGPYDAYTPLTPSRTLLDLGIQESSLLRQLNASIMSIHVKTLTGKSIKITDIRPDTTFEEVKLIIQNREGIPPDQQRLVFNGLVLDDDKTLQNHDIASGDTIHLILRLRGGMYMEVSSRQQFENLALEFPTLDVRVPLCNHSVATLSLRPGDFASMQQMQGAVLARTAEIDTLLREQAALENNSI